jgi:RNA polymerase sigma-70 factor (ECF subfamily)
LLERFLAAAEEGDLEALEALLAQDAVLYADGGGKAMTPPEPLVGAQLIARFMAAVAQVRSPDGELESRMAKVNGQPGRVVRGPAERPLEEIERIAAERALALVTSGDPDSEQLSALMKEARGAGGPAAPTSTELRVWSVLTVDVVDGRIQTVRIVRNPDKLRHL